MGGAVNASRIHNKYMAEALKDAKIAPEITPEWIINRLLQLADTAPRHSDKIRCIELLGQTLALFKSHATIDNRQVSQKEYEILVKYVPEDRLKGITISDNTQSNDVKQVTQ